MNIVLGIGIVGFCTGAAVICGLREKNIYNPATLFFGFWAFVSAMAALHLYDLYPVSDRACWLILLGLAGFLAGYLLVKYIRPVHANKPVLEDVSPWYELNYKVLIPAYIVVIAYLLMNDYTVLRSMISGISLADIRKEFFEGGTSIGSFIQSYVINIVVYIALAVGMVNIFTGRRKKLMFALLLAVVVTYVIQSGGRLVLYRFVLDIVIACLIFRAIGGKYKQKIRRAAPLLVGLLAVAVIAMAVLTILRSSSFKTFYLYFAGCFNLFDMRVNAIDTLGQQTYGYSSAGGLLRPLFIFLDNTGIVHYPDSYLNAYATLREQVEPPYFIGVGLDMQYNAYVTPFLYYYLDFRIPGIIVGSALYGAICSFAYKNLLRRPDIRNIAIYILIAEELFTTMIRWQFTVPSYFLALAVLLLGYGVFRRKKGGAAVEAPLADGTGTHESP